MKEMIMSLVEEYEFIRSRCKKWKEEIIYFKERSDSKNDIGEYEVKKITEIINHLKKEGQEIRRRKNEVVSKLNTIINSDKDLREKLSGEYMKCLDMGKHVLYIERVPNSSKFHFVRTIKRIEIF